MLSSLLFILTLLALVQAGRARGRRRSEDRPAEPASLLHAGASRPWSAPADRVLPAVGRRGWAPSSATAHPGLPFGGGVVARRRERRRSAAPSA